MISNSLNHKTSKKGRGFGSGRGRVVRTEGKKENGMNSCWVQRAASVWHKLPTADKERHETRRETMKAPGKTQCSQSWWGSGAAPFTDLLSLPAQGSQQLLPSGETHGHFLAERRAIVFLSIFFFFLNIRNNSSLSSHSPDIAVFSTIRSQTEWFWFP